VIRSTKVGYEGLVVEHAITHGPSFAMLRVDLAPGEVVVGEAGAMVARNDRVLMRVKLNAASAGGLLAFLKALVVAILRRLVGGETFFVNEFRAEGGGSLWLAPPLSGQIVHRRLNGETLVLSTGAYLAHAGDVRLGLRFGGLRGLLAKEGAFFLTATGHGDLFFSSYGGVVTIDVNGSYIVDNGHLVGYEGDLSFTIKRPGGGLLGLAASGEGLVCEFSGRGHVLVQTRNLGSLVSWLSPLLPG
jgi:uncharacterized protein (TIGR00266 family)